MSIHITHWLILGINIGDIPNDDYDNLEHLMAETYEPEDNLNKCCLLLDCMGSEYCLAGKVIQAHDETSGFPLTEIKELDILDADYAEVGEWLEKHRFKDIEDKPIRYLLVTNFA